MHDKLEIPGTKTNEGLTEHDSPAAGVTERAKDTFPSNPLTVDTCIKEVAIIPTETTSEPVSEMMLKSGSVTGVTVTEF